MIVYNFKTLVFNKFSSQMSANERIRTLLIVIYILKYCFTHINNIIIIQYPRVWIVQSATWLLNILTTIISTAIATIIITRNNYHAYIRLSRLYPTDSCLFRETTRFDPEVYIQHRRYASHTVTLLIRDCQQNVVGNRFDDGNLNVCGSKYTLVGTIILWSLVY